VPIGAVACSDKAALGLAAAPGGAVPHASTFGGNALATAAAVATVEIMTAPDFMSGVRARGAYFLAKLQALAARCSAIVEVRGSGMMLGIILRGAGAPIAEECLARGLLINCTAERVLRLLPPLIIGEAEIDRGLAILEEVLRQ
jgi:acetylornithine/N-succinyldiaminopimelate aminotransferase